MSFWGVAIPGLAMTAQEIPQIEGLLCLDNPEVGKGITIETNYALEEIALLHAETIAKFKSSFATPLTVIGMSMGGMVVSILASHLRARLPTQSRFSFLVTSSNPVELPAIPEKTETVWKQVRPGSLEDFENILTPFFSSTFRNTCSPKINEYIRYRASGKNGQSAKAYFRQVKAVQAFEGSKYFSNIDPEEALFIGGEEDLVLGPPHSNALKTILPTARHNSLPNLGHMINIEQPNLFYQGGW